MDLILTDHLEKVKRKTMNGTILKNINKKIKIEDIYGETDHRNFIIYRYVRYLFRRKVFDSLTLVCSGMISTQGWLE